MQGYINTLVLFPQDALRERLKLLTNEKAGLQSQVTDCRQRIEQEGKVSVKSCGMNRPVTPVVNLVTPVAPRPSVCLSAINPSPNPLLSVCNTQITFVSYLDNHISLVSTSIQIQFFVFKVF